MADKNYKNFNFSEVTEHGCNKLAIVLSTLVDDKQLQLWENNVMEKAFRYQPFEKFGKIWEFAEEFFTEDQIKILLSSKNDEIKNNSFTAATQNEDERVFEFFLAIIKEKFNLSERGTLISHKKLYWIDVCQFGNIEFALKRLKKSYGGHFKDFPKENVECQFIDFLEELSDNNFNAACRYQSAKSINFLCDEITQYFGMAKFYQVLDSTDANRKNVLMNATANGQNPEVFEILLSFIEEKNKITRMLVDVDDEGRNILMIAFDYLKVNKNVEKVFNAYEKNFEIFEVQKLLLQEDNQKQSVFDMARKWDIYSLHVVWIYIQKRYDQIFLKMMLQNFSSQVNEQTQKIITPLLLQIFSIEEFSLMLPKLSEFARSLNMEKCKELLKSVNEQVEFSDIFYKKLIELEVEYQNLVPVEIDDSPDTNQ